MPQPQLIDLPFPIKGLNEIQAVRRQPEGTTPGCLNVRPFDPIGHRMRGGQRGGLSKYFDDAVNGSNPIQEINSIVTAFDPDSIVADQLIFSDEFSYANGSVLQDISANWTGYNGADTSPYDSTPSVGDGILIQDGGVEGTVANGFDWCICNAAPGSKYVIKWTTDKVLGVGTQNFYVMFRAAPPANEGYYLRLAFTYPTYTTIDWLLYDHGTPVAVDSGTLTIPNALTQGDVLNWEIRVSGNIFSFYCEGVLIEDGIAVTLYSSNTAVGLGTGNLGTTQKVHCDYFYVYTGREPATLRDTKIIVVSGGSIYAGKKGSGLTIAAGGTGLITSGRVDSESSNQKHYFCDGLYPGYKTYDPATHTASAWAATAGQLPGGGSGTSYPVTAADTGTKTFTATGASVGLAPGDFIEVYGSTGNDGTYKVTADDGADNITVAETIPSSVGDGRMREADKACRNITLYRGRLVLFGLYTDPQNWFMSAVGAPLDWDYFPSTTSATMAVAGNNSDAGKLGDILNCCAPYSDDLMIMGGDHTLWAMRGDPAAGGVIDSISYQTGIAGPDAFAWDPAGNLYFFGSGGLWRMAAGSADTEPISRNRMDTTFQNIDLGLYRVRMLWDNYHKGVHMFFTPDSQPSTAPYHYYWDERTDSFWKDQYPATVGPTAAYLFDADDPDDTALLLGGFDSYVRYIDNGSADDDGTVIGSHVWYAPLIAGDMVNQKITRITAIVADNSNPVRLEVHAAKSAEQVVASGTARFSRTLTAGRNAPILQRAVGNALAIKLVNDETSESYRWAIESMQALVLLAGRQRHGRL